MMFKLQHPGDLISRLFILEYMRKIGAKTLYEKAHVEHKRAFFYKFTGEGDIEEVDINWEHCLFQATMPQLDQFMKGFLEEIEAVDVEMEKDFNKMREAKLQEELAAPVDVSIYDIAQAEMARNKDVNKLTGI